MLLLLQFTRTIYLTLSLCTVLCLSQYARYCNRPPVLILTVMYNPESRAHGGWNAPWQCPKLHCKMYNHQVSETIWTPKLQIGQVYNNQNSKIVKIFQKKNSRWKLLCKDVTSKHWIISCQRKMSNYLIYHLPRYRNPSHRKPTYTNGLSGQETRF